MNPPLSKATVSVPDEAVAEYEAFGFTHVGGSKPAAKKSDSKSDSK
jgi:hypothetical protein